MSPQVYCSTHRVTYAECTLGNHVYHSRYLDILEAARGEWFRTLGPSFLTLQGRGVILPIVSCQLRYLHPARYDDILEVRVGVSLLRGVRVGFGYEIRTAVGTDILTGETIHACCTLEERPQRLPADLVDALRPYLASGPASPAP